MKKAWLRLLKCPREHGSQYRRETRDLYNNVNQHVKKLHTSFFGVTYQSKEGKTIGAKTRNHLVRFKTSLSPCQGRSEERAL